VVVAGTVVVVVACDVEEDVDFVGVVVVVGAVVVVVVVVAVAPGSRVARWGLAVVAKRPTRAADESPDPTRTPRETRLTRAS
jgi:hypothetical protein